MRTEYVPLTAEGRGGQLQRAGLPPKCSCTWSAPRPSAFQETLAQVGPTAVTRTSHMRKGEGVSDAGSEEADSFVTAGARAGAGAGGGHRACASGRQNVNGQVPFARP